MGQDNQSPGVFERFVLKYGYEFNVITELPPDVPQGVEQRCFGNAALTAHCSPDKYAYVEGYAFQDGLPISFQHAWLIDRQGRVIEPTWTTHRKIQYYGVIIKHKYIKNKLGLSMIDDWKNHWPLVMSSKPNKHLYRLEDWIQNPA